MGSFNRVISQQKPEAATIVDAYISPHDLFTVVRTIYVTNQSSTKTSFRISIGLAGAADSPSQYLFYDSPVCGNETVAVEIQETISDGDVIRVYSTSGTCSFTIFGQTV